jgi:hypothetical protein
LGSPGYLNKPPFLQVRAWHSAKDPRAQLDKKLEVFKVWSSLTKQNKQDPKVFDYLTGKPAKELSRIDDIPWYQARLKELKQDYEKLPGGIPKELVKSFEDINDRLEGKKP